MNRQPNEPDAMRELRARQRIRDDLELNLMVEAAAGTGKTTSIVERMLSLIATGRCSMDQMVAVTFTRKAAAELRHRFEAALRSKVAELQNCTERDAHPMLERLRTALESAEQSFIGTIHSFCAKLVRERPIEFGVAPDFRELESHEDRLLRDEAWELFISDLFASNDPLISQLDELGIDRARLKPGFDRLIEYGDVEHWPHDAVTPLDLQRCQQQTHDYIAHIRQLVPCFPAKRETDQLMDHYEALLRASSRSWQSEARFFRLLEMFDNNVKAIQKYWPNKQMAKEELQRFEEFKQRVVRPALAHWYQRRYATAMQFLQRALLVYERIKASSGGLDFTDVLIKTARGLRRQPELRRYFQQRFTHLLVDEFQDTDPIQAEAVVYLASQDVHETNWQNCRLRPGALFLVGDPKQSIYRFRRGDCLTYERVKVIFKRSGGEVLSLTQNFRSTSELLEWNNALFASKFPSKADDYAPAFAAMTTGRQSVATVELQGIFRLNVAATRNIENDTRAEAESIADFIHHAVAHKLTTNRFDPQIRTCVPKPVEPRDFLIITRNKSRICHFKAALESLGIACDVTGTNVYSQIEELQMLLDCLRAADDPYNPVHYLCVLRKRMFAFSDAELYEFKRAGGCFLFSAPLPVGLAADLSKRFQVANTTLQRHQRWLRFLPAASAVQRIAEDVGLLASAAARDAGNVVVGAVLKAIETLRQQSCQFDCAGDVIGYLEQLTEQDESEGCAALASSGGAVRIMNLHKAKGLEAPIVFLADTSEAANIKPHYHIDRSTSLAQGYLHIAQPGKFPWSTPKTIALPSSWDHFQEEERKFLTAERNRLLYVAATRAANMLVISCGRDDSGWNDLLNGGLGHAIPELKLPSIAHSSADAVGSTQRQPDDTQIDQEMTSGHGERAAGMRDEFSAKWDAQMTEATSNIDSKWRVAGEPGYVLESVKKASLRGSSRPKWEASGNYGVQWGTAIHELLEIYVQRPNVDLGKSAQAVAEENGIEPYAASELIETVQAVGRSDIWKRARSARRCYSEMPFDLSIISPVTTSSGSTRSGSTRSGSTNNGSTKLALAQSKIVRGVIDLVFEESGGWVIVDYKADDIDLEEVPSALDYYRPQLEEYARCWQTLTGFAVAERGIYFTKPACYRTL